MAEAVQGKKVIFLYRVLSDQAIEDAFVVGYKTEDSLTISKSADSTATKSGTVRTPAPAEIEHELTSILEVGDTEIKTLKDAMLDDELIELWLANIDEPVSGETDKYYGTYYQGYITDYELTANAEDMVEVTLTIGCNGKGADGNVTVTESQIEDASYVFVDTPAVSGSGSGSASS